MLPAIPFVRVVGGGSGGGSGDVTGPASSADNALARFDGAGGKTIQSSAASLDDAGVLETATLHATSTLNIYSSGDEKLRAASTTVRLGQDVTLQWMNDPDIPSGTNSASIRIGAGSPEGVVGALVGSLYLRTDGGAGTCLYVKESGSGDTGWVAK